MELNLGNTPEEDLDLTAPSPVPLKDSEIKATMATLASAQLEAQAGVTGETAEEKYGRFLDLHQSGEELQIRDELTLLKYNQVKKTTEELGLTALETNDPETLNMLMDFQIGFDEEANKFTIIEKESAAEIVDRGLVDSDREAVAVAGMMKQEVSLEEHYETVLAKEQIAQNQLGKWADRIGFDFETIVEGLTNFLPGFTSWYNSQNIKTDTNPFLPGDDIGAQKAYWDSLSLEEQGVLAPKIDEVLEGKGNDLNAFIFWSYMHDYTSGDRFIENSMPFLDVAGVYGLISPLAKAAKSAKVGAAYRKGKAATMSLLSGNRADATEQATSAVIRVKQGGLGRDSDLAVDAAEVGLIDSQLRPVVDIAGPNVSARTAKVLREIDQTTMDFINAPTNRFLSGEEVNETIRDMRAMTADFIMERSPYLSDIAAFVKEATVTDIAGNMNYRAFFGTAEKLGFPTEAAALAARKSLNISEAAVVTNVEEAGTYFLQLDRRMPLQGQYIQTYDTAQIGGGGGARRILTSTTSYIPELERMAAHLVGATREATLDAGQKLLKVIKRVPDKDKVLLGEVLEDGRLQEKWFNYTELVDKGLSPKQIEAYYATASMDELLSVVDNSIVRGRLERLGFKEVKVRSKWAISKGLERFNAKVLDDIPNPNNKSIFDVTTGKYMTDVDPADIKNMQRKGYVILELEGATEVAQAAPIQFVMVSKNELKVGALPTQVINKIDGGRVNYIGEYFLKQGRVRKGHGPVSIMLKPKTYGVGTQAEVAKWADQMEAGRRVANAGGSDAQVAEATGARFGSVEEFKTYVGEKNMNMPFEVVRDGEDLPAVTDLLNSGKAHALAEDVRMSNSIQQMIRTKGSRLSSRGEFRLKDHLGNTAPIVNPIESATRSLDRASRVMSIETWKDKQVAKFSQTFSRVLVPSKKTPMGHFLDPEYIKTSNKEDMLLIEGAKKMQEHYKMVLNTKRSEEVAMQSIIGSIVDKIAPALSKVGIKGQGVQNIKDFDPLAFSRSVTFNEKLGLFNLSQPFVQLHASVLMATAAPTTGFKAIGMTPHLRMMLLSEHSGTLGKLAQVGAKINSFGTTSDTMKEAFEVLKRTNNWQLKSGSLAEQDGLKGLSISSRPAAIGGKILEAGKLPFIESERFNKIAGTTSAYLEWRKANPTAKITDDVIDLIRTRGNQLVGSMDRVDHATWQRGILGTLTQFWGYQARMTEMWLPQMMGGNASFSRGAKARIALGQLSLYGLEGTLGAGVGYGLKESIRESYRNTFGDEINNTILETVSDGFVDMMFLAGMGLDVNTHYRVGAGYTEQGIGAIIKEMLADPQAAITFKSAPMATVSSNIKGVIDIVETLAAVNTDIVTPEGFDMAVSTFGTFFRDNISSYSRAEATYLAWKTGNQYDRVRNVQASGLTGGEASGILFGLDPSGPVDARGMQEAIINAAAFHKKHVKSITKAMNSAVISGEWDAFEFYKDRILGTVNNDLDKIEIMSKVLDKFGQGSKKDALYLSLLKRFGPQSLTSDENRARLKGGVE